MVMPPSSAPNPPRPIRSRGFLLKVVLYGIGFGASILISRGLGRPAEASTTSPSSPPPRSRRSRRWPGAGERLPVGSRSVPLARLWAQGGLVALVRGALGGLLLVCAPALLPGRLEARTSPALGAGRGPTAPHAALAVGVGPPDVGGEVTWRLARASSAPWCRRSPVYTLRCRLVHALGCRRRVGRIEHRRLGARSRSHRAQGQWIRWDLALLKKTLARSLVLHAAMVLLFLQLAWTCSC